MAHILVAEAERGKRSVTRYTRAHSSTPLHRVSICRIGDIFHSSILQQRVDTAQRGGKLNASWSLMSSVDLGCDKGDLCRYLFKNPSLKISRCHLRSLIFGPDNEISILRLHG